MLEQKCYSRATFTIAEGKRNPLFTRESILWYNEEEQAILNWTYSEAEENNWAGYSHMNKLNSREEKKQVVC